VLYISTPPPICQ